VVGSCDRVEGGGGFLWRDGQMIDLGVLPGWTYTYPTSINDRGVVAGTLLHSDGPASPFVWEDGVLTDVGTSGVAGIAALNERGQIAGWRLGAGLEPLAVLWDHRGVIDLGLLPGQAYSQAIGLNNRGVVVGRSGPRPFVWQDGVMRDLGTLPGTAGATPLAINDRGVAVGQGETTGEPHAVMWPRAGRRPPGRVIR
jgi:probable HAF family extracellular repeat protein